MKAIVLYEPWATLMAIGAKRVETRPRPWSYVGDVAICAGQHRLKEYCDAISWLWQLRDRLGFGQECRDAMELYNNLPTFGKVVCVVNKTGCISDDEDRNSGNSWVLQLSRMEQDLGHYGYGRFYYPTENPRRLTYSVPVQGRQFVFNLAIDVEKAVRDALPSGMALLNS